jgi:hypothetical protein
MTRSADYPRVTFGIIVLNGEPFTRYCLRSIYPYAHQIIVVEGGHEGARSVTTADGHSVDGTLEALYRFKEEEDPLDKLEIVVRDGHWPQKDELGLNRTHQSRAYADRATGDYLWQIDIDEFYRDEDMVRVLELLRGKDVGMISFRQRTFWASPDYEVDCWALHRGLDVVNRVFRWGPGYRYVTHEPPMIVDARGRDVREGRWLRPDASKLDGIYMYHYSLLFPWQVRQKTQVYSGEKPDDCAGILDWAEHAYFKLDRPYRVHNLYESPSWLQRYYGGHPAEVYDMMDDLVAGIVPTELRPVDDVERLLASPSYRCGRAVLKAMEPVDRLVHQVRAQARRAALALRHPHRIARKIRSRAPDGGVPR